ncbi:MAG: response regulator [Burkholderiales bacterium]|nr:response regulator [Burkholderiales bacterium]
MAVNLLVIEDSALDYEVILATLASQGIAVEALRVQTGQELAAALEKQPWDIVISDHNLPDFSSGEALDAVRALPKPPPFIIVSGTLGEDAAVEAMRRGADDFLIKGRLARLGPALRNAMENAALRRAKAIADEKLRASEEQLSNLTAHLQTVVDEERAEIAREIHDDVGGTLTALKFEFSLIEKHIDDALKPRVRRALETLSYAVDASQRIARNLHPPILDAGLVPAIEWQVRQFQERTGISARFRSNVDTVEVNTSIAMTVYRVCQETLTNISKHAGASRVEVDLHYDDGFLSMEVSDDGRGITEADLRKAGSFGLRGLAERARKVNGLLDLSSAGERTTVMLSLPLNETAISNFGELSE